jgi:hypothetical protein
MIIGNQDPVEPASGHRMGDFFKVNCFHDVAVYPIYVTYILLLLRNSLTSRATFETSLNWHSRTTRTRHPNSVNCPLWLRSRRLFTSSFSFQKSILDLGSLAILHPSCPCQKHPCMKITACLEGKTMSGVPGRFLTCRRYRKPIPWTRRRSFISGAVSLPRILDMRSLRSLGERVSTKPFLFDPWISCLFIYQLPP